MTDTTSIEHAARVYTAQHRAERKLSRTSKGTRRYCKELARDACDRLSMVRSIASGSAWLMAGQIVRTMPDATTSEGKARRRSFVRWARDNRISA